jgi:XTP/dITP diphosphohydrolase
MLEIVLASNNANKAREITEILGKKKATVLTLPEVGFIGEIEETGETLAENALIKARIVAKKVPSKIIMADDTGLEVDYLAKAPGVYSARFAGPECSYIDNNIKLLKLLKGVKKKERGAVFRTVMAVIYPNKKEELYEGRVSGYIAEKLTGNKGFGYDPVFYPENSSKTYAQMDIEEKNLVSHRMKAVKNAWNGIKASKGI